MIDHDACVLMLKVCQLQRIFDFLRIREIQNLNRHVQGFQHSFWMFLVPLPS